ncbi:MAG: hypothetical protein INQ03_03945 [Candidatus Heimdallarchaeota archaeon]|nr:hypothetical protein [Candidatus Heimdallarchaeota archaeon]
MSLCKHHFETHSCEGSASINENYEQILRDSPRILTTGKEFIDLILAILLLLLVFALRPAIDGHFSLNYVLILGIIIAPAFILHELAHKYAAMYFNKFARFALIKPMTIITVIVAFFGYGIAGPGGTFILGDSDDREKGIFAAAGPAINIILSLLFYLFILFLPPLQILGFQHLWVLKYSIFINSFLGLFNLIPFGLLDGKKVITWSKLSWILLIIANGAGFMYSFDILSLPSFN